MPSSYSSARSIAIIDAWLEDITSSRLSTSRKRARSFTAPSLSHRKRTALATSQGNVMKRAVNHDENTNTPKRQRISIDQDDTPRAGPFQFYTSSLLNHDNPEPLNRSMTPSTESVTQSSKSQQFSRASSVKGLNSLMMTETPVVRSDEISNIPCSGRDLYKDLLKCKAAHQVLPNAIKASILVECLQHVF